MYTSVPNFYGATSTQPFHPPPPFPLGWVQKEAGGNKKFMILLLKMCL